MRVAKSNQLRRLLQTQDVCISVLVAALCVNVFSQLGAITAHDAVNLLKLLGFVGIFSVVASIIHYPRLHGQTLGSICFYAFRYAALVVLCIASLFWLTGLYWDYPEMVLLYFVGTMSVLIINRVMLRWWYLESRREHRANYIKVVIVGSGNRAKKLVQAYRQHVDWSVDVVAIVEPDEHAHFQPPADAPVIRNLDEFDKLLAREIVDEVVICLPRSMLGQIGPVIAACEEQGICVKFMADLYDAEGERYTIERVGELPILNIDPVMVGTGQYVIKRLTDLVITIVGLMFIWPLLLVIAIAIKMDSKGPVFFKQQRVGLNKRPFQMVKFRSMRVDAENEMDSLAHLNEASGPIFKIHNDPRITRVGRFLRRYSLDELPQLLNVLKGHMSLIGPRPMSKRDVERFNKGVQQRRFSVRPGLACLREIEGRSKLSFDRWLELDLQYIDSWSFGLDLKIMVKLIPVVLSGSGAS